MATKIQAPTTSAGPKPRIGRYGRGFTGKDDLPHLGNNILDSPTSWGVGCGQEEEHWEAYGLSFPPEFRWRFIVTLRAYFDAGKEDKGNVLSVAGYLWAFEDWVRLEKTWRRVLGDSGLDFFHMTDYATHEGPYKDWNPKQHLAVISRLIEAITDTATLGISVAIALDDYNRLDPQVKREVHLRSPYRFAASWCMGRLARWLEDRGILETVAYIFELGDTGQGLLNQAVVKLSESPTFLREMRVHSVNFEGKRKRPALQAADILAYETGKQTIRRLGLETRPTRRSLLALVQGVPHSGVIFDAQGLQRYIDYRRLPLEQRSEFEQAVRSEMGRRMFPRTNRIQRP